MTRTILLIRRDGSIHPTGQVPVRHYGHCPMYWRVATAKPLRGLDAADVPVSPTYYETVTYRLLAESEPYVIYEEYSR